MTTKRKLEDFGEETLTHPRSGGRPPRVISDVIPEFVARKVVMLYVTHLRGCVPESWSERQLNHLLFGDAYEALSSKVNVFPGLKELGCRKSIPRLTPGQVVSDGMLRAERDPRFSGGLQILYHPYTHALAGNHGLRTLHSLLSLVPTAFTFGLVEQVSSSIGIVRNRRTAEVEIELIATACEEWRSTKEWRNRFPDVMACALLLAQEAAAISDNKRLKRWQRWFRREALLFKDWPVGGQNERQALDRWVQLLIENLYIESNDAELNKLEYIGRHVLPPANLSSTKAKPNEPYEKMPSYGLNEISFLITAIQSGNSHQMD